MLFDTQKETHAFSNSIVSMSHPASFISSQDDYLSKYLREIDWRKADECYHFTSNGRFALHDMLIHIASRIGDANCIVSSFNLSVIAAKMFIRAWDKGFFKSLAFVLNAQKKSNFADAIKLIDGKFPMVFTNIHAKVGLLWNDKQFITIVTTGNLSSNNNIERGFISTAKDIFDFDKKWIDELFN
ncbi:MAG: hypothetical protein P1P88_01210 [Bacteroidales bacterium]|nr:hypothetical protein [Bacteroidales bacterium]